MIPSAISPYANTSCNQKSLKRTRRHDIKKEETLASHTSCIRGAIPKTRGNSSSNIDMGEVVVEEEYALDEDESDTDGEENDIGWIDTEERE